VPNIFGQDCIRVRACVRACFIWML